MSKQSVPQANHGNCLMLHIVHQMVANTVVVHRKSHWKVEGQSALMDTTQLCEK